LGGISQILFGNNNNNKINSPIINIGTSNNKNDALQGKYRLASPSIKTSYIQGNIKYGINSVHQWVIIVEKGNKINNK